MSQQGKEPCCSVGWVCTRFKQGLQASWLAPTFFFSFSLFLFCLLFPHFPPPTSKRNNFKLSCAKRRNKLSIPDYTLYRPWNKLTSLQFRKSPFDPSPPRKSKGISFDWIDEQELLSITRATVPFINPVTALPGLLLGHLENGAKVTVNPFHQYFPPVSTGSILIAFVNN